MAINISLPPRTEVDGEGQPIPRSFVGFDPKVSDDLLWDANRGAYDLEDEAGNEQFATFSFDGTIRLVAELEGIETVDDHGTPRKALLGRILRAGDPVRDALVGKPLPEGAPEAGHIDTDELDAMSPQERYADNQRPRRSFLLTLDPDQWFWSPEDEQAVIARTAAGASVRESLSAGGRRHGIEPGDRVFLLQKGAGARGVRGIGRVSSRIYQGEHWDDPQRQANYIDIDWDVILSPDEMIELARLTQEVPGYGWNPQRGGVELHEPMAGQLDELWVQHTGQAPVDTKDSGPRGWELDDKRRRAARHEALRLLTEHYVAQDWEVVTTVHDRPYWAVAYKDDQTKYLFARAAETAGRSVIFNQAELEFVHDNPGQCVMGVVTDAEFQSGAAVPGSGSFEIIDVDLDAHRIQPIVYRYWPFD